MPSDPMEKLRELLETHKFCCAKLGSEIKTLLPELEQRQRERALHDALTNAIMCIEENMDTPGTEFDSGKECKSVASFVDDWRAALNPTNTTTPSSS